MVTTIATVFPKMLKALRENSNIKEKREALTYISSQAKKLESSGVIKEERYKDLCRTVIELFAKDEGSMQYEALGALNAIVQDFKAHSLHLFESLLLTDRRTRVKILKLLEIVEDNAISAAVNDGQTVKFFEDCMSGVQSHLMEWITPTDNLQILTKIEQKTLTDEQKLEEDTINYSLALLKRLYKLAAITYDQKAVEKFDRLLISKVVILAYMGHKRQRDSALKLLQQAAINFSLRVRENYPELWAEYKANLQSMYCNRMLLLVTACEPDWSNSWNITIQLLGTDLHRGAGLINNLLSVEEKAFKSTDAIIRRQAFLSWKLLIDNFALDHQELATARRIKLLCIPLNAKNSKTELIALTKLEVWWHLIFKLYKDIAKFATPVITQFLNFCFGPLGDTPLLSYKFDVVASPGKRFFKTKLVAVDALYELIVLKKKENATVYVPMLEEKLPHAISHEVFQECSKSIIHSVGEALLILSQFTEQDVKHIHQRGKILWASLIMYIKDLELATKDHLYRDVILVVTELATYIDKHIVKDMIFNVILPDINQIIDKTEFIDYVLQELVLKLLSVPVLGEVPKTFNCNMIKCLLQRCINSNITHSLGVFGFVGTIMENLKLVSKTIENMIFYAELWSIIAEMLTKYIESSKKINEGDENEPNFKTVKSVLSFPFQYTFPESFQQTSRLAIIWKTLYNEFEMHSGSINTVKPNEILLDVASMMRVHLDKDNCFFIVNCLDILSNTIIYEDLLAQNGIPSIMQLIVDLVTISFDNQHSYNCETSLKILSAILITVYGHNPQKVMLYLDSCRSVIELMVKSQTKTPYKELTSIWETVVSIFKGLKAQLSHELLSSYKTTILIAMEHSNSSIRLPTRSIFEIKDSLLDSTVRSILEEIESAVEKSVSHSNYNNATKKKDETGNKSEVRIIGSFLNRKSTVAKTVTNKVLKMETVAFSEPDSQEYVYIKTDLKFDVNRLTEHQKETLKKKREDIPALYNDLSQSSSQNSQNIQEWFDMKAKHINEFDKANDKKSDSIVQKLNNNDANKENKVTMQGEFSAISKVADNNNSNKIEGNVGDSMDIKQKKDMTKKTETIDSALHDENVGTSNTKSTSQFLEHNVILETDEEADVGGSIESVVKKLNFESIEEFPEDNTYERQSSPSMFDTAKRRHRGDKIDTSKSNSSLTNDEAIDSQKDSSATNIVQRTLKMKNTLEKPSTSNKQLYEDTDIKENTNENKKSAKRKYMSDTESDSIMQQSRRRKLNSSFQGFDNEEKSQANDNTSDFSDKDNMKARMMKTEISRLKIDMVFDCPTVNRRRTKYLEDGDRITTWKRPIICGSRNPKHKSAEAKPAETKSAETKSAEAKSTEMKSAESSKRCPSTTEKNPKDEKETKDVNDTNQGTFKRRNRRSMRQETDKNDSEVIKATNKTSETKSTADKNTTRIASVSQGAINSTHDEKLDKSSPKPSTSKNEFSDIDQSSGRSQNEAEDIVECSQTSNVSSKLDKRGYEKQCFIKINKIPMKTYPGKIHSIVEKNYVPESIPVDCGDNNVPDPCIQSDGANTNNNTEENEKGNKDSINKDPIQEADNASVAKSVISESQKTADTSSSVKFTNATSVSSKGSGKIFSKLKSFTAHGRAAHMLGLVTKQTRTEGDISNITSEDDMSAKKSKAKDVENETPSKKAATVVKDADNRIGGSSGTRQEKIFSNMKLTDHTFPSTHIHTYALRSDSEKLSSKLDKNTSDTISTSIEISVDKESDENTTMVCEKDDLPILEWSSANPPSLTASPSASILKRHRSSMPMELDADSTPNKRKRVSFADPPVSKEMGYEISAESPHRENKYATARGFVTKKDSPLKFKQLKLKFATTDGDKSTAESDAQSCTSTDVVTQDDKVSESLSSAMSEISSDIINVDEPIFNNFSENNIVETNLHAINIDDFAQEVEIAIDSTGLEDPQLLPLEGLQDSTLIECIGLEDSETQQDLFDGMDTKNNGSTNQTSDDKLDTSIQNNSADSFKLNVINDSVIQGFPAKADNLEDTVDVLNITELNFTTNPDEIFCGKLLRSSTAQNVAEQDTLPATDSMFASLPSSLDSRNESNRNDIELDPEFLDSTQPICPTLSSCTESIDTIVRQLTNPLWRQNLSMYFSIRNLRTIGDLAQLSEREIYRMPIKGSSKIEFVRKVLRHFESMQEKENTTTLQTKSTDETEQLTNVTMSETSNASITPDDDSIEKASASIDDKCKSTPLARPTKKMSDRTSLEESPAGCLNETNDANCIDISPETGCPDRSVSHVSAINEHASYAKVPIATSPTSPNVNMTKVVPSSSDKVNVSATSDESNVCDASVTQVSVGVNTDEMRMKLATNRATKATECQMKFEDLLDEIDINLVLENVGKRCSHKTIFSEYKTKLAHLPETVLMKETIGLLGLQNKRQLNDLLLKTACRVYGVNGVLVKFCDIFKTDKQFFEKVLKAYNKKLKLSELIDSNDFDSDQIKSAVHQKYTSPEIVEMLSDKLNQEEQEGIRHPMPEISTLNAILQRLPIDMVISHTIANEEVIPASIVLDIALQNNSSEDVAQALKALSQDKANNVLEKLCTSQFLVKHIQTEEISKESLLDVFKTVCSKLTPQELLNAYHQAMTSKLITKGEKD